VYLFSKAKDKKPPNNTDNDVCILKWGSALNIQVSFVYLSTFIISVTSLYIMPLDDRTSRLRRRNVYVISVEAAAL